MAFSLTTHSFSDGEPIPVQFTCDGADAPPPLAPADTPDGTQSFALIMDDPDAPNGTFTHWLAYDIPPGPGELRPSAGKTLKNSFGREGYGGPCPPKGHGSHRYYFTLYAVDVPQLELRGKKREDLEAALQGHTLATARLMGRHERADVASIG